MKKLKIFLIAALVIILGGGGYLLYMFKFKEYDIADEEVSEIVADPYKVELPDGTSLVIDEQGKVVIGESGESENNTNTNTNANNNTTSPSTNEEKLGGKTAGTSTDSTTTGNNSSGTTTTSTEKPTVASIKDKYRPAFEGLEAQADTKINALIGRAVTEYNGKKASGEKVDFGYFYNKYMAAAGNLEASTDTVFNAVLGAVEKDLAANGYDKSYAQSFKDEYEATKKARRDGILKKAMGN
ncbi:hypothetical protein [Psychrobacillus lasiicapitis]|uniref:Uncharacterized protein n=1 Tax=Psychrobacillus lasiicapitis TaxID=1636719 RepID=A0A544TBM6_9BACI|nr:hypothetical protein [Psychrobacillus lasiicapitis]TQR14867.1 hypothetical protein FG382_05220 [Psychrobacillus lasiicapitis]GGA20586.1 hypothetical protein GCM10011384_07560 [Psychrobacillus lasiicapitis]